MPDSARLKFTFAVTVLVVAGLIGRTHAQSKIQPVNDRPNPYETIRSWGQLPPGRTWGSTSAIEVDHDGKSIWVGERCGTNSCEGSNLDPILKFDPSGKLIKSFGGGLLVFPHGIHIDRDGNIWVVDGKANSAHTMGHQVLKFSPEGKILMRLGTPGVAGHTPTTFDEPCDVITAPNGDIFVSDGHGGLFNNPIITTGRIVKFTKDGKYIKEWGSVGTAPGQFRTPHALAFDSQGRLFVADRRNLRLQIFDLDGKLLDIYEQFGRVSDMHIGKDGTLYAIDSESDANNHPGWRKGVRIGNARSDKVDLFIPGHVTDAPEGAAGEGITVDAMGNIYAAEVTLGGLTKYVRKK